MSAYQNETAALSAIDDEAAKDAYEWLQREKPQTLSAIEYLIYQARWTTDRVTSYLDNKYGDTEQRVQHKMKLVVEAIMREKEANGTSN